MLNGRKQCVSEPLRLQQTTFNTSETPKWLQKSSNISRKCSKCEKVIALGNSPYRFPWFYTHFLAHKGSCMNLFGRCSCAPVVRNQEFQSMTKSAWLKGPTQAGGKSNGKFVGPIPPTPVRDSHDGTCSDSKCRTPASNQRNKSLRWLQDIHAFWPEMPECVSKWAVLPALEPNSTHHGPFEVRPRCVSKFGSWGFI